MIERGYRSLTKHTDRIILVGLTGLIVAANGLWRLRELRPPHWDMARHLLNSLQYWHILVSHHQLYRLLSAYFYYPPLVYWATLPFYAIFGVNVMTAVLSNIVWLAILVGSTYGIGRTLAGRRAGLVAAVIVVSLPMLVTQFKEFQVDAPLTAMVTLALYLLIRTENFTNRRYSLWLGAVVGLGALTKWTFPFIVALPLVVAIMIAAGAAARRKLRPLANVALSGLIAYAIAAPWYIANAQQIMADLRFNSVGAGILEGDPVVGTLASNLWYYWNLINHQLYLFPFLLLLGGLVAIMRTKRAWLKNLYPLLLIVGVYGFFTLLRNKDARYTLPMLPAMAVIMGYGISQLRNRWRTLVSAAVIVYSLAAFMVVSFGCPWLPYDSSVSVAGQPIEVFGQHGYIIGPPSKEQWHQEDIFKLVAADTAANRKLYYACLDTVWFNNYGALYYADKYQVGLAGQSNAAQYVALRFLGSDSSGTDLTHFRLYKSYVLPDQSSLLIYQRAAKE